MLKFRVNDFITLKLENGQTNIYLDNNIFRQCKFLLLEIPIDKVSFFSELSSIDEAAERLDKSMERAPIGIPVEVRFWAHCSNLQVWAESNYNTTLLHSNLSFPLLKELCKLGDLIAKKCFKEEVAKRLASGYVPVVRYLLVEGYLESFNRLELEVIFQHLESFLVKIEKTGLDYDESIFEILRGLTRLNFSRAEKIFRKMIINTFNAGDSMQFLQIMSSESLRYLGREDIYWDFISSTSKNFFENLNQIANMDFDKYLEENPDLEDFEYEDFQNIIFQAQETLNFLNKIPIYYFIRFMRNLASFPIEDIANLLDLISDNNYYLDDVKVILNDNWLKFKNLFVKVKDKFVYVNRDKKSVVLKNLNISFISEIDSLEMFGFLEELDMSNNKISKISNLDKMSKLRQLNLSFNQVDSVKDIGFLPNLENLVLVDNKLSQLEEFNKFSNLTSLNLEGNCITGLRSLYNLGKLEYLNLSKNKIQVVPKFINLRNINKLILSNNNISSIDFSVFENLKNIKYLHLSDNDIKSIEGFKHLKELTNLEQIRISNNPICKNLSSIPKKYKNLFAF